MKIRIERGKFSKNGKEDSEKIADILKESRYIVGSWKPLSIKRMLM